MSNRIKINESQYFSNGDFALKCLLVFGLGCDWGEHYVIKDKVKPKCVYLPFYSQNYPEKIVNAGSGIPFSDEMDRVIL